MLKGQFKCIRLFYKTPIHKQTKSQPKLVPELFINAVLLTISESGLYSGATEASFVSCPSVGTNGEVTVKKSLPSFCCCPLVAYY